MDSEKFKVFSWNIRGAGNARTRRIPKSLLADVKPDCIFISEPHIPFLSMEFFGSGLAVKRSVLRMLLAIAGGLWCLGLLSSTFTFDLVHSVDRMITIKVSFGAKNWLRTGVYANPIPLLCDTD